MSPSGTGLLDEVVRTAAQLRQTIGLGDRWPLILDVPTGVSVDLGVALAVRGITVVVNPSIKHGLWYLRDGVKR